MAESQEDRRKRLKGMRAARNATAGDEKVVKFRNYVPQSAALAGSFEAGAEQKSSSAENGEKRRDDGSKGEEAAAAPAKKEPIAYAMELEQLKAVEDTVSVVPKEPNWDLKRDVEPKLAILAKRTQNAIVDIIREKLANATEDE